MKRGIAVIAFFVASATYAASAYAAAYFPGKPQHTTIKGRSGVEELRCEAQFVGGVKGTHHGKLEGLGPLDGTIYRLLPKKPVNVKVGNYMFSVGGTVVGQNKIRGTLHCGPVPQ